MRPSTAVISVWLMALFASSATAQEMYTWKDRNGTTQYSDTPPASGDYATRQMRRDAPSRAASGSATPTTGDQPASEDPRCASARQNLAMLQSEHPVKTAGADGNGKPLSREERARHLDLAKASMRAYDCKEIAPES